MSSPRRPHATPDPGTVAVLAAATNLCLRTVRKALRGEPVSGPVSIKLDAELQRRGFAPLVSAKPSST